jgi:hypothetical protein
MGTEENNLSKHQQDLIDHYDKMQKPEGKFSRFLEMGLFSAMGSFFGVALPAISAMIASAVVETVTGSPLQNVLSSNVAIGIAVVGVAAGAIGGIIVANDLNEYRNKEKDKEKIIDMELSPEDLSEKKIKTMININNMREKSRANEIEKNTKMFLKMPF